MSFQQSVAILFPSTVVCVSQTKIIAWVIKRLDFVFNFLPDDLDDGFEFGAVEAFAPVEVDGEADAGDGVAFFIAVEGVLVPVGVGDFEVVFSRFCALRWSENHFDSSKTLGIDQEWYC